MKKEIEKMLAELPPLDLEFPTVSKVKKEALVEFLYYKRKADAVFNRYRGVEWTYMLRDLYNRRAQVPETSSEISDAK